jgi:DNA mismatch repair ATPase MutS
MSKLLDKYLILKKEDPNKLYLFRCGKFYIFLDEDCDFINNYVVLKKTPFTNDVLKCGFPDQSLQDYIRVFENLNLNVEIIENEENKKTSEILNEKKYKEDIIKKLSKLNIEKTTPIEAFQFVCELKELLHERNTNN